MGRVIIEKNLYLSLGFEVIERWWFSLTKQQQEEFISLEKMYMQLADLTATSDNNSYMQSDIVKDWIEDHGGNREWWNYIRIRSL